MKEKVDQSDEQGARFQNAYSYPRLRHVALPAVHQPVFQNWTEGENSDLRNDSVDI
jgi:hypothetical protein